MYRSNPFRSTLNTGYITGLDMCKVVPKQSTWSPLQRWWAFRMWSPLQAPLKPTWSPLQAPRSPLHLRKASSPLQAPLKPPWSPLEAPFKPPSSPLEAPFKPPFPNVKPPWSRQAFVKDTFKGCFAEGEASFVTEGCPSGRSPEPSCRISFCEPRLKSQTATRPREPRAFRHLCIKLWLHHVHLFIAAAEQILSYDALSVVLYACCKPVNTCRDWDSSSKWVGHVAASLSGADIHLPIIGKMSAKPTWWSLFWEPFEVRKDQIPTFQHRFCRTQISRHSFTAKPHWVKPRINQIEIPLAQRHVYLSQCLLHYLYY